MAYDEVIAQRIRRALGRLQDVEEKLMFRGVTFMVNGKMCISVGKDRIMCRIDPARHDELVERNGARAVVMKGKPIRGFLHVFEEGFLSPTDLDFWIRECLAYNAVAKAYPRKKKKRKQI